MISIGETLRAERQRRNLDLQEVSRELKIPARFLEAIEQERFDILPAPIFAKSFVRQYARLLGLHEDEMADAVQHAMDPPPSLSERQPERPPSSSIQMDPMAEWERVGERRGWSSSLPALAMVVVVMLACSGVYAWWQRSRHTVAPPEQIVNAASPPTTQAQSVTPPPIPSAQAATGPAEKPAPATGADRSPLEPASLSAASRTELPAAPPTTSSPVAEQPAQSPSVAAPAAALQPAGPVHVEITASEIVWIFAKADGKTSFTGTLEPNQSRTVDASGSVVLRLGNAGGAHITLNGKPIGDVGPRGQPRTVEITANGFQVVAPPKPPLYDPIN